MKNIDVLRPIQTCENQYSLQKHIKVLEIYSRPNTYHKTYNEKHENIGFWSFFKFEI